MIRCIAIDDEPLALAQIVSYINKTPFLELTAACSSAIDAVKVITEKEVNLLFVDINMPDLNGMDFVKSLVQKPLVIFTTAYSEYALEGFKVDALDYLLKPIGYSDFLKSAEKSYRQYKLINSKGNINKEEKSGLLFVKTDYKQVQLDINSITYLESRSEYVRIYFDAGQPIMTLGSMKSFEENLPSGKFMRIHRSYIVNLQKITAIERSAVLFGANIRIPIGEQYKEALKAFLDKNSLLK